MLWKTLASDLRFFLIRGLGVEQNITQGLALIRSRLKVGENNTMVRTVKWPKK